jgi:hypothetical protein
LKCCKAAPARCGKGRNGGGVDPPRPVKKEPAERAQVNLVAEEAPEAAVT